MDDYRLPRKKLGRQVLAAAGGLALLIAAGGASAGIANTKHNLGTGGTQSTHVTGGSDTAEICVFCHTPHGADTTATAPLWNKNLASLPVAGSYQTYNTANSSTIDGEVLTVGSVSLACLSCHDGTQAMDNIINAPGSGGYDATGGGANGLGYTWTGNADANGKMTNSGTNKIPMLGTDLRDDHPIGIAYCGGGISNGGGTTITGTCTDYDFYGRSGDASGRLKTNVINSVPVFWLETGTIDSSRTRTDIVLYGRTTTSGANPGANRPTVECASCHDPHVESGQAGPNSQTAGATFLRIANAGSAVCLACHIK